MWKRLLGAGLAVATCSVLLQTDFLLRAHQRQATTAFDSSSRPPPLVTTTSSSNPTRHNNSTTTTTNDGSSCDAFRNRTPLFPLEEVRRIVQEYHDEEGVVECLNENVCRKKQFDRIGQLLLEEATAQNKLLVTVQIGGMDGSSNDPMYEMFVKQPRRPPQQPSPSLQHWMPVVVEPVPQNFRALQQTYREIAQQHGLQCPLLAQQAISYEASQKQCTFCHFNVSDNALEICNSRPDWQRYQLGTLDCDYSRRYYRPDIFEQCIIQDQLQCGTIVSLLDQWQIPADTIAILQVDIEGYEYMLLTGLIHELLDDAALPPVIHFEHKVMQVYDKTGECHDYGSSRQCHQSPARSRLRSLRRGRGYTRTARVIVVVSNNNLVAIRQQPYTYPCVMEHYR